MKSVLFGGASAMALALIASAGGTITSGDASFAVGVGSFSGVFDATLGDATLKADGASSPDLAYKYCWYYRTQGNTTNRVFSSLDTPVQTYVGDTATATYTNAGPGLAGATFSDRFNAVITTRLVDGAAPGQVRVEATCEFTSSPGNLATRTWQVFSLVDLDLPGGTPNASADDSIAIDTNAFQVTQTEASSANFAYILPLTTPTRFQIGSGSSLRSLLTSIAGNLNNATSPISGQDVAAAFQWEVTLAPGESRTLQLNFAVNTDAIGGSACPPCAADYDDNGGVDGGDLASFFVDFEAGEACADVDENGGVDGGDLGYFFQVFEAGGC